MSLRARLTIIYGGLLALVLIGIGFGAEVVMQGRFRDQTQSSLTSAANYVFIHLRVTALNQYHYVQYHLPVQKPFANVYQQLVSGADCPFPRQRCTILGRSLNLQPDRLSVDRTAVAAALFQQAPSYHHVSLGGDQLEVYYTKVPTANTFAVEPSAVLMVATSQADITRALDYFNAALFGGMSIIWLLVVAVTWLVAGSALRPIGAMTQQAATIADTSDFAGRVPAETRATELERLAVTFNRMLESLQQAYANQQRFLADASHELRTPLTSLQANLHFLEGAVDAPRSDRAEALHAARIEADRMGFLVGDLLSLSQADAGYSIQHDSVELDAVIVDGFRRIQARERSSRRPNRLRLHLGRVDEIVVKGDKERLLQLVLILLDNAAKYTPDGGSVTLDLELESAREALIRVTDSGVGIAAEDRDHIFERFFRSKSSRGMGEGSGLGLPIARWIAEAHAGSIAFTSTPGKGTTFTVRLPALSGNATMPSHHGRARSFPSAQNSSRA